MDSLALLSPSATRGLLVAAFAGAAVVSLAALRRCRTVEDDDTRTGLRLLLLTSAGWALAYVGYLLAPTEFVAVVFHQAGLIVGFATLGPWLYFASAYTGRSLHRRASVRRLAVAVFLLVVAVKLTNAWHGLYFDVVPASEPFTYWAIEYGTAHWVTTGLSYAVVAVGYFMLFELFLKAGYDARPLAALVAVTGLPIGLNIVVSATPGLPTISFEPIGVAAFAIGVLYLFTGRFQAVQLAGDTTNPVIYLDDEGYVRDCNPTAMELFPALEDGVGEPLADVLPAVDQRLAAREPILELDTERETRFYRFSTEEFALDGSTTGRLVVLTNVTESETHRRELQRQNERLERFASVVSHDLRNPLEVAKTRLELAAEADDEDRAEHLAAAEGALDRMETLIEDVLTLARQGESIGETEAVKLSGLVERCRETVRLGDTDLVLTDDLQFQADTDRVQQLLENLVRNAVEHGGNEVTTVTVGARDDGAGFFVADDGPGIPVDQRGDVFESGFTTSSEGTGFGLAIVNEIVEAHGWAIGVGGSDDGGARFDVTGVETGWAG